MKRSPARSTRDYLGQLAAARVAAVGFGIGLSFDRVPPELLEAAEAAGLPLLEVPLPRPFIAVTKAFLERLAEQRYEGAVRVSRVQPRMTRAALRGGPQVVIRELARATGTQVLLLASEGTVLTAHPPEAAQLMPSVVAGLPQADTVSVVDSGPHGVVSAQVIRVGRREHGRVVLVGEDPLAPVDHLVAGHAVSLIALDLEKPHRLRDAQNRLNAFLFRLLTRGQLPAEAAAEHLAATGFPTGDGVTVVAFRGAGPRPTLAAADEWLGGRGLPCFGLRREDSVIIILLRAGTVTAAQALATQVRARVNPPPHVGLAISAAVTGIPAAARQATIAADIARARGAGLVEFATLAGQVLVPGGARRPGGVED